MIAEMPLQTRADLDTRRIAVPESHPGRLAAIATLMGVVPGPVECGRILVIGCLDGGNLASLAQSLPSASFVGLERDAASVDETRGLIAALNLPNVEIHECGDAVLAGVRGQFDLIITQKDAARGSLGAIEAFFEGCAAHLAEDGLFYFEYSTLPGASISAIVGELARLAGTDSGATNDRLERVRATIALVADQLPDGRGSYGQLFRDEADRLLALDPDDTAPLSPFSPMYFHQVEAIARRFGLRQIADARLGSWWSAQPSELRQVVEQASSEPAAREQVLDFLRNRRYRRSVLGRLRDDEPMGPVLSRVDRLYASSLALPIDTNVDVATPNPTEFRFLDKPSSRDVSFPYLKALLVALADAWPAGCKVAEVIAEAQRRLRAGRILVPDARSEAWSSLVVQAASAGLIELSVLRTRVGGGEARFPKASPVAIAMAKRGPLVVNLRHHDVLLEPIDREFIQYLDGTRDERELGEILEQVANSGHVKVGMGGPNGVVHGYRDGFDSLRGRLMKMAMSGLLVK